MGERRAELQALVNQLSCTKHISKEQRLAVVKNYREVIG